MVQLRVLGGVVLQRDDTQLAGVATQRHQLALLAFLAAAPGRNASRDRLIAYLWPELEGSRARHRLSVALHVLRRAIGEDCITTSGDSVTLAPEVVWTDVGAFHSAVSSGRLEEAAEIYAGPFMDGFSLSGAVEYEHWVDAERARLARLYRTTLEQLINHTAAAGDLTAAAKWWRLLAEHEPYSARVAIGLVRALAAIEDLGGALRHAQAHAALVQGHLDVPPDPTVLEIANQLVREAKARSEAASLTGSTAVSQPGIASGESTHTGPARESDARNTIEVAARAGVTPRLLTGRNLLAVGLAFAFFTAVAGWRLGWRGLGEISDPSSVAVLSFRLEGTSAPGGWGDALAERIRANLAYVPELVVVSVAPVSRIDQAAVPGTLNRVLDVTTIVSGTIERSDDRLSVTTQLLDGQSGDSLSAWTFEESAVGDSSILDKLAFVIADSLRLRVASFEPHHYTGNDRAYDRFLQGVYSHRKFTRGDIWAALQLYREGYEEDSTFALAHAISGNAYLDLALLGVLPEVAFPQAREHLIRALELDSTLEEGHAAMGFLQVWGDRDFAAGERSLIRAIMLHPNLPQARAWFGWYALYVRGWVDVAISNIRKALEVDPLNTARSHYVEWGLYESGQYEEALAQHEVTWSLDIEVARSFTNSPLAASYRELGRYDDAIAEYQAVQERTGVLQAGLAITYARMGRTAEAREMLIGIEERAGDNPGWLLDVAGVHANLGDFDLAFQWMERAEAVRPDYMLRINWDRNLAPLRVDPRFEEWLRRIGLTTR